MAHHGSKRGACEGLSNGQDGGSSEVVGVEVGGDDDVFGGGGGS
ncbi:hypothetical protein N9042_01340 [bacterium]|nr:hypothetical protein [bacterium]